jgi:hypothetical protein
MPSRSTGSPNTLDTFAFSPTVELIRSSSSSTSCDRACVAISTSFFLGEHIVARPGAPMRRHEKSRCFQRLW